MNKFLTAAQSHDTVTFNGAVSHSTSGSSILDYFSRSGSLRNRSQAEVNVDLSKAYAEDKNLALKVIFYNRMITRKVKGFMNDINTVQRGQGNKDEFIKSLQWLSEKDSDAFEKNLWAVPLVGKWSDLWYDSPVTGVQFYANPKLVYKLIEKGIASESQRPLIAKYLPKIRSTSNVKNERHRRLNVWALGLCKHLGWTERDYRKFKSSPENSAHLWQRQMSANQWSNINFDQIPGKAIFKLVNSRKDCLTKRGLSDKLESWVSKQNTVKFNGYPYELLKAANSAKNKVQKLVIDKQFEQLLAVAKDKVNPSLLNSGVLCALDTSSSMTSPIYYGVGNPMNVTPYEVCVGLGIYFSSLIEGAFKDNVVMFDNESTFLELGGTFTEKVAQIQRAKTAWGGTNFQSVIDEIVRVRKTRPDIPVEEYPKVLLVVSDMQFNCTGSNQTNYEAAMSKLKNVGLPAMTIVWWQVNGGASRDVPSKMDDKGTVLISGFDGAIVSKILEAESEAKVNVETGEVEKLTPYEVMIKALDQELLNLVSA